MTSTRSWTAWNSRSKPSSRADLRLFRHGNFHCLDGGKALLSYLASPEAQNIYLATDSGNVGTNNGTDTSKYNALQKKAAELVGQAKHITQFLDRDTRPDFASTVMIPSLQKFIAKPADINSILDSVEQQKQAIFTS